MVHAGLPALVSCIRCKIKHIPDERSPDKVTIAYCLIILFMYNRLPLFRMKNPISPWGRFNILLVMPDVSPSSIFTDTNTFVSNQTVPMCYRRFHHGGLSPVPSRISIVGHNICDFILRPVLYVSSSYCQTSRIFLMSQII